MKIGFLDSGRDRLGESPVWDNDAQALFWVDAVGCKIRRYMLASGAITEWTTPDVVGSIGLIGDGTLVAALRDGFYRYDLASATATPIMRFEPGEGTRLNDGKADRFGRFLSGTMNMGHVERPSGTLHRLDHDGSSAVIETGIAVSNALCFSPRGDRMYFADSLALTIWVYDYDGATGAVANRRVLVDMRAHGSAPDGATVDREGCLWVALVQTGRLARFAPDGALDRMIDLPVPYPTCPAFGGPSLDTLYVTSISDSGGRLVSEHPDAGRVVTIEGLGVTGLREARYMPNGG